MNCHKCFRPTYVVHINTDYLRVCDFCHMARLRILAKIRMNRETRRERIEIIKIAGLLHPTASSRAEIIRIAKQLCPRAFFQTRLSEAVRPQ